MDAPRLGIGDARTAGRLTTETRIVRLVILVIAAALAAAAVGMRRRGPRYAYVRWYEPDAVVPRVGAIFDGP